MTRFILYNVDVSYGERCYCLNILPLSFRREFNDLMFLFKYFSGVINVDFTCVIRLHVFNTRLRSGPYVEILMPEARTESFKGQFFNRVAHLWNILPFDIRSCSSLNVFKTKLMSFYYQKLNYYDVNNSCTWTSTRRCTGSYHS